MKTRKINLIIAFVMSIVMVFSMSLTEVSAENVVGEEYYCLEEETEETIIINLDEMEFDSDSEASYATASLNAKLAPKSVVSVSLGKLTTYQKITITVKWTSSSYPIYMGIYNSSSSTASLKKQTGGSGTFSATMLASGYYSVAIYNPSETKSITITSLTYEKSS